MADDPPIVTNKLIPFTLQANADGAPVVDTLISEDSRKRALSLYAKQLNQSVALQEKYEAALESNGVVFYDTQDPILNEDQQQLNAEGMINASHQAPPENYVVKYYIADEKTAAIPPQAIAAFSSDESDTLTDTSGNKKNVSVIRSDNPAETVNQNMDDSIQAAFRNINSQLPGRFSFVRVLDPKDADINFTAVPNSETFGGDTNVFTGSVVFNANSFTDSHSDPSAMRQTALHEILHTLGLEHPQNITKSADAISTEDATFYDTVMTYDTNDQAQTNGVIQSLGITYPTSLMPADLEALVRLYPIAQDARNKGAMISRPADLTPSGINIIHQVNGQMLSEPVLLPKNPGIVYQPMVDTENDTLDATGATVGYTITPNDRGVVIKNDATGGYAFLPVHAEKTLELSYLQEFEKWIGSKMPDLSDIFASAPAPTPPTPPAKRER